MPPVLILIPPSETKLSGGYGPPLRHLAADVQPVYERLMTYRGDKSGLYGVKGKALEAACVANAQLLNAPTLPAIERYTGVVYDGIDYPSLPDKAKAFLTSHVRIVNALFGLLKPDAYIPDYKLKMEKLNAADYWRPLIKEQLRSTFIVDLLPQAHQKAVEYEEGIKVDFFVYKNSKRVAAGHQGKLIKGKFIRWLCQHEVLDKVEFADFKEDGFRFDGTAFIKQSLRIKNN